MTDLTPIPEAWIEKLFHKMLLEYGKKFTDQWGMVDTGEMIKHWSRELAGYSGDEVRKGVEALSSRAWPPTLPEFKTMCRAPVEPLRAFYEAVAGVQARFMGEMGEWSHPAIYWAAMPMAAELREQGYAVIGKRWEAALTIQLARAEWEPIPQPALQLEAPGKGVTSNQKGQETIKRLIGNIMHKPADFDHRGWAKSILARDAAGDKTLKPIQVRFAREALGAEHVG